MRAEELRTLQNPLKERYRQEPTAALVPARSAGTLDPATLRCHIHAPHGEVVAGLHRAAGGDGSDACSGDLLLDALVACAGVTVCAVATAMGIELRGGEIKAEGTMDFRGTLGVDRQAPVGLTDVHLSFHLEADAPPEQMQKLIQLTERYCVILQTLQHPPHIDVRVQ